MDSTGISELTVVIPTVARPQFILRQYEYWRDSDASVLILDGAKNPIDVPSALRSENIRYVHSGKRFNERLATASQYVTTEFCALLPDDEFYLFTGLRTAIERLKSTTSDIGCVGRCLYFFVDQGRFLVRDAYRDWLPFERSQMRLAERLDADLPPRATHKSQFAVLRSDVWKKMFDESYRKYFSCGYTYERLLDLQRTILGTTSVLEVLLWMRSMENPPISNESVPRVGGRDFVSWARSEEFSDEVREYREIAKRMLLGGGLSTQEASKFENRFFLGGVDQQAKKEARNGRRISRKLGDLMLFRSPRSVRRISKRYLPPRTLRFTGWEGYELDAMCSSLESRGTSFSREELERIKELSIKTDSVTRLKR